jgi:hypothetical protein
MWDGNKLGLRLCEVLARVRTCKGGGKKVVKIGENLSVSLMVSFPNERRAEMIGKNGAVSCLVCLLLSNKRF